MGESTIISIFIIWLAFCFFIAKMAKQKGKDQVLYFFIAILFSPLLALLILVISGEVPEKQVQTIVTQIEDYHLNREEMNSDKSENKLKKYEAISKLGELRDKNLITDKEFYDEKQKILSIKNENINTEPYKNLTKELKTQIKIAKRGIFKSLNKKVPKIINSNFTTKEELILLVKEYQKDYGKDLIEELSGISSQYSHIEFYLKPFIENQIVESNPPYKKQLQIK